jgi:hypothetical protein
MNADNSLVFIRVNLRLSAAIDFPALAAFHGGVSTPSFCRAIMISRTGTPPIHSLRLGKPIAGRG